MTDLDGHAVAEVDDRAGDQLHGDAGLEVLGRQPRLLEHGAVGGAQVGDDRRAVVGAGAGPDLEVGRGDLLVRARDADQPRLLGGGEPPGLGRPTDDDRAVDLDDLAAGEDQPRDRRARARRGRGWPGMPGWLRAKSPGLPVAGPGQPVVVRGTATAPAGRGGSCTGWSA